MAGVSMKDIKLRIKSMESTKQITKAMEMVAASKLRRAQDRVANSRPYFEILFDTLNTIANNTARTETPAEAAELDASSLAQRFSVRERYTPISDEATEAMQKLALEDAKNSVRSVKPDQAGRANLIREQLRDVDPSKRTASFNTMNKVWESELDRIGSYIQEKDPGWTGWGSQFDTAILEDYKAGVNIWI